MVKNERHFDEKYLNATITISYLISFSKVLANAIRQEKKKYERFERRCGLIEIYRRVLT